MSLISIKQELYRARQSGYAVLLVDVFDIPSAEGTLAAFEARGVAGILAVYGGVMNQPNARALSRYLRLRAEEAQVPVSLMLDHGASIDQCFQAVDWGFSDVMYDGSLLSLEENIANTRQVVEYAHSSGVNVEAELGHVGSGNEYREYGGIRKGFTNPDQARRFVEESGVDYLAVAIGTAHGLYDGEPFVDIDLLQQIRQQVEIPLVLHGGTGLSPRQFSDAILAGIAKINVASDMFAVAGRRLSEAALNGETSYFRFQKEAASVFQERSEYYLDIFQHARDFVGELNE
jgi:fructose-bisphosphate aldolase, class II